jgi:hypothetical protein
MEKEIGKLTKNDTTEIVIRIDDFGGKRGLTIREFVTSERYTGFTKAGVRISPENFKKFKEMIESISEDDLEMDESESGEDKPLEKEQKTLSNNSEDMPDY